MCWKVEPTERPSFVDIHEILLSMLKNCEVRYTTNSVMFTSPFDCFFSHLTKCSPDQRAKMPCFGPRTSVRNKVLLHAFEQAPGTFYSFLKIPL